jgi:hypothetical protein
MIHRIIFRALRPLRITIEGLWPFDASQGFFDSLTALWHPKSGFPRAFTLIPDFFLAFSPERCYDYRETR